MRIVFLIIVSASCISACTREMYPGADVLPEYLAEEKKAITDFIDALEAEAGMTEIWCVPPGTIIGQRSSEDEEFQLSGDLFDTFNPHCIETQAAGVVIDSHGAAVVLEPMDNGTHYIRIDVLRLNASQDRKPVCGWFSYLLNASPCDIPLEDGWVARYRWDDSNDIEELYN